MHSQMAPHVALNTEFPSATGMRALERLFARVRVNMDFQRGRPHEFLEAKVANVVLLLVHQLA